MWNWPARRGPQRPRPRRKTGKTAAGAAGSLDSCCRAWLTEGKMTEYAWIVAVFVFFIWFWNSLYIIKEWERGAVLRLGRMRPDAKGAGLRVVLWPIET